MRTEFLCIPVLRVASGPRVKLSSCKTPRWFILLTKAQCKSYSLLLCGSFYEATCFKSLALCCFMFFGPFSFVITSLEKEIANINLMNFTKEKVSNILERMWGSGKTGDLDGAGRGGVKDTKATQIVGYMLFKTILYCFFVPRLFEESAFRGARYVICDSWCMVRGSEFIVGTL